MSHARNIGIITALLGAIWTVHKDSCSSCSQVPKLAGYSLSKPGLAFYGIALAASLTQVAMLPTFLRAAAYTHGALVVHMIITNQLCPACLLTAFGSIVAARDTAG